MEDRGIELEFAKLLNLRHPCIAGPIGIVGVTIIGDC
jgi:hypothetical protein